MSEVRSERFESLDHWRGIACLSVVIYHSTIVYLSSADETTLSTTLIGRLLSLSHQLNVGVALFFVISGYCIAAAADSARRRNATVGEYFVRRFRRIYPPFWIVVAWSVALFFVLDYGWSFPLLSSPPWAQLRPWWYSPSQWVGNLTLTETWRPYIFGSIRGHFPGQAWTLCYEEQFYFITGMLLLFVRRRFFTGVALVSLATFAISIVCRHWGIALNGWFFDGAWLLFAAGVGAYYGISHATGLTRRAVELGLIAAAAASLYVDVPIFGASVGFGFAAALPWLHKADSRISASVLLRPLFWCGRMCYSLYLVHQLPVKAVSTALYRNGTTGAVSTLLLTVPLSVGVALALGWAFHLLVERRFLNSPMRLSEAAPASPRSLAGALA